jgi:hypothetical protein
VAGVLACEARLRAGGCRHNHHTQS